MLLTVYKPETTAIVFLQKWILHILIKNHIFIYDLRNLVQQQGYKQFVLKLITFRLDMSYYFVNFYIFIFFLVNFCSSYYYVSFDFNNPTKLGNIFNMLLAISIELLLQSKLRSMEIDCTIYFILVTYDLLQTSNFVFPF